MIQAKFEKLPVGQHLDIPFSAGLKGPRRCPVWPQNNVILPSAALKFTLCQFLCLQHQNQIAAHAQDIHPYVGKTCETTPAQGREDSGTIASNNQHNPFTLKTFSCP